MARFLLLCVVLAGCLAAGGCAGVSNLYYRATGTQPPKDLAAGQRPPQSLHNFKLGREYAAQGRYELAREQYLLAYAGAGNDALMRNAAAQEVQAMDMMIKTQR